MRTPSVASDFQCSVISWSSSFAIVEYKSKRGSELSPGFDCLSCDSSVTACGSCGGRSGSAISGGGGGRGGGRGGSATSGRGGSDSGCLG
jgi:hypothetical protein